ncbi:MAG: hypothetical protein LLG06_01825 [Desulfobacteraceae bacterium]|nr:hypothetical protein [Desulfobacteraceae bacterium]
MSILTNKQNLPQQIVSAIMRDPYSRGEAHISVTQLIQPPRIIQLRKRYDDKIEEDASDRIWSLLGQTCHKILERSDDTGAMHEERIGIEVNGWWISGQSDCYITEQKNYLTGEYETIKPTIRDYKFIKTMAADFAHPDWEQQLNILAYLWREQGFPVDSLEIVAIFRDWSKAYFERGNYPPPAKVFKQKLWTHEAQEAFVMQRVLLHQKAEEMDDKWLPHCTPEEQWRKAPTWAIRHPKRVKAVRVLKTLTEAEAYIKNELNGDKHYYAEHRPGGATRCESFCDVAPFCSQYQYEKEADAKQAA